MLELDWQMGTGSFQTVWNERISQRFFIVHSFAPGNEYTFKSVQQIRKAFSASLININPDQSTIH
jgi:hypothetical protein